MKLVKLVFNEDYGLRRWADMKKRIWIATQMENPGCNSAAIVGDIQAKWINFPNIISIWAAIDDDENIRGHVVAWVETTPGEAHIFVFQLISDPQSGALMALKEQFLAACCEWIDSLNDLYEKAKSPLRINQTFLFNTRHAEAFERIFAGRCSVQYTVVEIDVSPAEPVSKEIH